jgi:hypothetical protein
MQMISTEGFEKPKSLSAAAAPMLQWLKIAATSLSIPLISGLLWATCVGTLTASRGPAAPHHRRGAGGLRQRPLSDRDRRARGTSAAFKAINRIITPYREWPCTWAPWSHASLGPFGWRMSACAPRLNCCTTLSPSTSRRPDRPCRSARPSA